MINLKKPMTRSILFKFDGPLRLLYTTYADLFHAILLLKVLVVSDIKKDLGYCGAPSGHKDWRKVNLN